MMKNLTVMLLLLAATFSASAQNKTTVNDVTSLYLKMKDALLKNDSVQVKLVAPVFYQMVKEMKLTPMAKDSTASLHKYIKNVVSLAEKLATTGNVNIQRKLLFPLTGSYWAMIKSSRNNLSGLYLQRCPMTGVTWIAAESKIANPYYPKNMITCGEVIASK